MKVIPTTVIEGLGQRLREQAKKFNPALESPPVAVLWTDERRDWEGVLPQLQSALPELFALGAYQPAQRIGPGAWLRMVADGQAGGLPKGTVPLLYLPGVNSEHDGRGVHRGDGGCRALPEHRLDAYADGAYRWVIVNDAMLVRHGDRLRSIAWAGVIIDQAGAPAGLPGGQHRSVGLYWQIGEYISGKLAAADWGEGVVDSHRRSIWLCERRSGPAVI